MARRKITLDSGTMWIICFFVFAIVSLIVIAIKDTIVRTTCIEAHGNIEYGECKMSQEDS